MGFKLGSEKRCWNIPGKSNSPFGRKASKKSPYRQNDNDSDDGYNPYWNNTDWSITDDDGQGYDNFDLQGGHDWWNDPYQEQGAWDSSQVDGTARWDHSEPDDAENLGEYSRQGSKDPATHPQFRNKKYIIGAQFKWMPFVKGFDARFGRKVGDYGDITKQSLEQRTQKEIAEKLYTMATRDVASAQPTTTAISSMAQGAHFEAAYHSPEFRNHVRRMIDMLISEGGDPSKLMIEDLHQWNSYDQIAGWGESESSKTKDDSSDYRKHRWRETRREWKDNLTG